jgi:hypothetical protein
MSPQQVLVRELIGWNLDSYDYRPDISQEHKIQAARTYIAQRPPYTLTSPLSPEETKEFASLLSLHQNRKDLRMEMDGLLWTVGVVDLRSLLAFQRRLSFDSRRPAGALPEKDDFAAITSLCFGKPKPIHYDRETVEQHTSFIVSTGDPNLQFRVTDDQHAPLELYGGSPFLEVACFQQRWFLRDGYHRAFCFLKAGIFKVPTVIVQARTLEELGATKEWFFSEETLFSPQPAYVVDYLDESLTIEYKRPALTKTIRVTIEETFKPMDF